MIVHQRMLEARIAEKSRKNKVFLRQLGVGITYSDDIYSKGETHDEKDNDRRKAAAGRHPDFKGNNIH